MLHSSWALCLSSISLSFAHSARSNTIVNTTSGRFSPHYSHSYPNVAQYLNIPYAQPPIGNLRFAPPVPITADSDTITTASAPSPACLQRYSSANNNALFEFAVTQFGADTSEDCLRLAVYAPKNAGQGSLTGLPVMVWIYGGSFELGGYATPAYDPSSWIEQSQEHIVVEFNYRVSMLGFPNAAGLAVTHENFNVGLLDQRLALEWVAVNIAKFGGDSKRITLWGESAGAESIDYLSFAYPHDPIARAMILESGSASPVLALGDSSNFTYIASELGCKNLSATDELACMRNVSSEVLQLHIQSTSQNIPTSLNFNPIADEVTAFSNYSGRIISGQFAKLPTLAGTNAQEGFGIVTFVSNASLPASEIYLADYITRVVFQCPLLKEMSLKNASGVPIFQYYYRGNFSNISPEPWLGAYHTSELPLVFGTLGWSNKAAAKASSFEKRLSLHMQDLWLAFVKDPVQGLPGKGWSTTTSSGAVLELGYNKTLQQPLALSVLQAQC